jgi:hypothetical protein
MARAKFGMATKTPEAEKEFAAGSWEPEVD